MQYHHDKQGSKIFFLLTFLLILYLAFFGFDIKKAYTHTVTESSAFIHSFNF